MASVATATGTSSAAAISSARYLDPASAVLPGIQMPVTMPAFMREGHTIEVRPVFSDQPMQTGTARRRHVYQSTPRKVSVGLDLNLTQINTFNTWFEGPMRAGSEFFSAAVAAEGVSGVRWWKARFIAPYTAEYLGGQWWKVTADLALFGDGATTAPMPTALVGGATVALLGRAALYVPQAISGHVTVALIGGTTLFVLSGHVTAALLPATYTVPPSVASAAGTSTAQAISGYIGVATGTSTVTGVSSRLITAVASSSSTSTAAGIYPVVTGVGSSTGTTTVAGVGSPVSVGVGSAVGTSTVAAVPAAGSARLREGGGYRLREDGSKRLRES